MAVAQRARWAKARGMGLVVGQSRNTRERNVSSSPRKDCRPRSVDGGPIVWWPSRSWAGVHFDNLDRAGCCGKRGIGSQTIRLSKVFNASRTVKNRIVLSSPVEWKCFAGDSVAVQMGSEWHVSGRVPLLVTARCLYARANAFLKANFSRLGEITTLH
jgi:hypothetical protein